MTSGTGKVTRVALETPGDKAKMLPPACLPARGSMELRGAARIRAAATDVAGSAVTLANEVHYNVLSN